MPSPLFGRKLPPGKKVMPMKSMADMVSQSRTAAGGGASSGGGYNSRLFRDEVLAAMGGSRSAQAAAVEDRLSYNSPELAAEAYKKGEFTKAEAVQVVANLGLASEKEIEELTPMRAIAMLEGVIKETEADVEAAKQAKLNPKKATTTVAKVKVTPVQAKKQTPMAEDKPAVIALKKKPKSVEKKKTTTATSITTAKKPNIVLKVKKAAPVSAQAASPTSTYTTPSSAATTPAQQGVKETPASQSIQPGIPTQPQQPAKAGGPNLVPGQLVEIDDASGQKVQYVVNPDMTLKPNYSIAQRKPGVPLTDEERLERHKKLHPDSGVETVEDLPPRGTGRGIDDKDKSLQKKTTIVTTKTMMASSSMANSVHESSKAGELRASAEARVGSSSSSAPKMEKDSKSDIHYTAARVGSRWLVTANGDSPVFSVNIGQSFPDEEKEYTPMFNAPEYGEELASACNLKGAASVIQDVYKGNVKMEFRKSAYDYEAELVEALENNDGPSSDQIVLAYAHAHPEAAKQMVALYNDKSVPNDQLAGKIRQAVAARKGQYNQYGLGDMFDRTYAPDSAVKGGEEGEGLKQEEQAIMEPDITDQMAAKEKDKSNIVELFAEVMSPIISLSDAWDVEDVVRQMKDTFSDDEKIARFRGLLEEKIKQDKEHNSEIVREKTPQELDAAKQKQMKTQSPDQAQPQAEAGVSTAQARLIESALKNTLSEIRQRVALVANDIERSKKETLEARSRLIVAQQAITEKDKLVDNLVRERSARLRLPKAKELSAKLKKVGINRSVKDIMLYTDEVFDQRMAEANAVLARMATVEEERGTGGEQLIGGSVPQIDSGEVVEGFVNPFTSKAPQ